MHLETAAGARVLLERLREIAIDFDDVEAFRPPQQLPGQRAAAGTDFNEAIAGSRRNSVDDSPYDGRDRAGNADRSAYEPA